MSEYDEAIKWLEKKYGESESTEEQVLIEYIEILWRYEDMRNL